MRISSLLEISIVPAAAVQYVDCPPLGVVVPPPVLSTTNLQSVAANLSATLDAYFKTPSKAFNQSITSLSLQIVNQQNAGPLFQYYHTAKMLNTTGTRNVTSNSMFRIGSISKVFVVLGLLLHEEKFKWNDPITKFIPELSVYDAEDNIVTQVQWEQITLEMLASQLAGVPRDSRIASEVAGRFGLDS